MYLQKKDDEAEENAVAENNWEWVNPARGCTKTEENNQERRLYRWGWRGGTHELLEEPGGVVRQSGRLTTRRIIDFCWVGSNIVAVGVLDTGRCNIHLALCQEVLEENAGLLVLRRSPHGSWCFCHHLSVCSLLGTTGLTRSYSIGRWTDGRRDAALAYAHHTGTYILVHLYYTMALAWLLWHIYCHYYLGFIPTMPCVHIC